MFARRAWKSRFGFDLVDVEWKSWDTFHHDNLIDNLTIGNSPDNAGEKETDFKDCW